MKKIVMDYVMRMVNADDETFDLIVAKLNVGIRILLRSGDSFSRTVEWRAKDWAAMQVEIMNNPEGGDYEEEEKDITRLTLEEVVAAMEAGGYTENAILSVKFTQLNAKAQAVYEITFRDGIGPDTGFVFIEKDANGKITGEY